MHLYVLFRVIAGLLLGLLVIACSAPRGATQREFELRGQILAVRSDTEVLIKHDEIKGFMPAMTMPYKVRDAALLRGKAAGDLVTGTLVVGDNDAWLTRLETTGFSAITEPVSEPSPTASVRPLQPGDLAPDTSLTSEHGDPIALTAWRGAPAAVTFIYTRCPLPQFCPLMDRRFAEVQRLIKNDPALKDRAHLLSVSFDPDHDRPEILRAHASKLGADPSIWRFATAPREVVDTFAAAFGVNVIREADRSITHNLRAAVVDPQGRVIAIYNGSNWAPDQIVSDMKRSLAPR